MRKIITILTSIAFFINSTAVLAQTTTPATSPATTDAEQQNELINQINDLKEKVASKVAELKLVERRGVVTVTTQVSGNKITSTDILGQTRFIDVDELTKFSSPSAKDTFGISDIKKGTQLGVIGLYNKQSKRILARFIDVVTIPTYITGVVLEVDKANFTISVQSANQTTTLVDVENTTRTSTYNSEDGLTRAGFSRIGAGDRVHIIGYADVSEANRLAASRIIVFPDAPANPDIQIPEATSSDAEEKPTTKPTITTEP